MDKLLDFYRGLTPQTRFRLIFFVLASLIWVPVRMDSGVEGYEPYRYDIDDVEDNQVVFAYRFINFAWGVQDYLWVIRKDGTCRFKSLSGENLSGYRPDEVTDEEELERMDKYMRDETLPEMVEKLSLDKERVNYCINLSSINLKTRSGMEEDSGTGTFYVVVGTGEERHLERMQKRNEISSSCYDLTIQYVCDKIRDICLIRYEEFSDNSSFKPNT